ncbi:MAG: HD domain-containing protein [Nitrospirota bacterium]|nr:HD domain-containing protein [Nitrospirota bacterium]
MRLIRLSNLKTGMIAGSNQYDSAGNCILRCGQTIGKSHQKKLAELGLAEIYVKKKNDEDRHDNIFSDDLYGEAQGIFGEVAQGILSHAHGERIDASLEKIEGIVGKFADALQANGKTFISYLPQNPARDYLSFHSINVCLYSLLAGMELGLDREELIGMGVGAFLHDIGLVFLEQELYSREDEFARQEIMEHSWRGYELFKRSSRMRLESLYVILQHHERFDGSGYPQGLQGTAIPEVCRVVAVADCYDALTTSRCYRPRVLPSEAVQYVRNSAAAGFDQTVTAALFRNISLYPVGLHVTLNNGASGYVVSANPGHPSRPVVRVGTERKFVEYDLSREYALFIERAEVDGE